MKGVFTIGLLIILSVSLKAQNWTILQERGTPQATYTQNDYMTTDIYFALNQDTSPYTVEFGIGPTENDGTGWTWYTATYSHFVDPNRYWKFTDDATVQFTTTGVWYYAARFVNGGTTYYADNDWQENNTVLNTVAYFQVNAPVPVELTSFTANTIGNGTELNWTTATEVNNYGFEIESSDDNTNWTNIGFVEGHGNSNSVKEYSFTPLDNASYYRLKQIDTDGGFEYSDVVVVEANHCFKLAQNHPNPFNPTTAISFTIPEVAKVSITIYNALGQAVAELANQEFSAGNHSVNFNASTLTSGIYFYRLESSEFSQTMKMILMK